jgi:hypothetical protein
MTQEWIERWQVRDSEERLHYPSGILTYEAHVIVYVLFDDNPRVGQRAHYLFVPPLQRWAWAQRNQKPILATLRPDISVKNTGAGYLAAINELYIDRQEVIGDQRRDDDGVAVALVVEQLTRRRFVCRAATVAEQMRGVDVVASDPLRRYGRPTVRFEIKSRTKRQTQDRIFVQVSETNPNRIIGTQAVV